MVKLPTLYLIDGSSYIFRAFYAVRPLSNSNGLPTNALYGFVQMIMRLLKDEKPSHLAIVFDSKEPTEREDIFPEYKANRSEPPDDLVPQFPYFEKITNALQIPTVIKPGVEADDIIGTMAHAHEMAGGDVVIVTGDKDFMQMVSKHVTLLDTMKERRNGIAEVRERFGVKPEEVVEVMGLMGDSVDNIPGVKGVGPKTAIKLIQKFHTVENIYRNLDKVDPGSLRQKLEEQKDGAMLSRNLVEIRKNIPLDYTLDELQYVIPSPAKFAPLFQELGFTRFLRDMAAPILQENVKGVRVESINDTLPLSMSQESESINPIRVISIPTDLAKWVAAAASGPVFFSVVTDEGHPMREPLVGIALVSPKAGAIYCPVGHHVLESQLHLDDLKEGLRPLLKSKHVWWGYDIKQQLETLHANGIVISHDVEDGLLMEYLMGGTTPKNAEIYLERSGISTPKLAELLGKGAKKKRISELDVTTVASWAGRIAQGLSSRLPVLKSDLGNLLPLYTDMELPLLRILQQMEEAGVLVDPNVLADAHDEFAERLVALESDIYALAGTTFNIQSPKQLSDILFSKMQIPVLQKTKTGASTNSEVLEELASAHPIAQRILDYRQLAKLQSTYVDALPLLADPQTGRIHTSYNQAVAATGRLSSSDPNLQNIPIRSEDGRRIRRAFVAAKGCKLISADYSQIELRILAHITDEPLLIEAFTRDEDVHSLTASQIFAVPAGKVTKEQRAVGKTVNFAVLYGQSSFGLSKQLRIPAGEAKQYIDNYFSKYPRVADYREEVLERARETGCVETLFGRRRFFPDLKHANKGLRAAAERMAFNTVFQGTAADIIKRAMIRVFHSLCDVPNAKMIMQVHDELVVEAPKNSVKEVETILMADMAAAANLKVPLTVDVASGSNWDEC